MVQLPTIGLWPLLLINQNPFELLFHTLLSSCTFILYKTVLRNCLQFLSYPTTSLLHLMVETFRNIELILYWTRHSRQVIYYLTNGIFLPDHSIINSNLLPLSSSYLFHTALFFLLSTYYHLIYHVRYLYLDSCWFVYYLCLFSRKKQTNL